MSKTYKGEHKAIVKESDKGAPYICFELLRGDEIPDFKNATLGLFLKEDTTHKQAEEIANIINKKLIGVYLSKF